MEWGQDQEPAAREAYVKQTGAKLVEVGMITHPRIPMAGASPDGLIGEDGLIEVKCLIPANHLDLLLLEDIPEQYVLQMNWQMACTGRKWCDFVSYDPSQAEHMQLFIKRLYRDEKEIQYIEEQVERFLQEVDDTVNKLKDKYKNAE